MKKSKFFTVIIFTLIGLRAHATDAMSLADTLAITKTYSAYDTSFKQALRFKDIGFLMIDIPYDKLIDSNFTFYVQNCSFYKNLEIIGGKNVSMEIHDGYLPGGININASQLKNMNLQNDSVSFLKLSACNIKSLYLSDDTIGRFEAKQTFYGGITILFCNFHDKLYLSGYINGGITIGLNKYDKNTLIDLRQLHPDILLKHRIPIRLFRDAISHLLLNYCDFKLSLRNSNPDTADAIYHDLMARLKELHQNDDLTLLLSDYRHYKYDSTWHGRLFNKIQDEYENYGKSLPFMICFTLFVLLLLSAVNYFFVKNLNTNVYKIENLSLNFGIKKPKLFFKRLYASNIYTTVIFISPLLKIEKLKYGKPLLLLWVLIVYFTGLILLYYILHYLIKLK